MSERVAFESPMHYLFPILNVFKSAFYLIVLDDATEAQQIISISWTCHSKEEPTKVSRIVVIIVMASLLKCNIVRSLLSTISQCTMLYFLQIPHHEL